MPEEEFWAEFSSARPGLLGALSDAVAGALGRLGGVRLDRLPRMADLARWVTAAEPALGWPAGSFVAALHANRQESAVTAVEGSLLGRCLVELARSEGFVGTATELLVELRRLARGGAYHDRSWPGDPRALSRALNRMTADLDRLGVVVVRRRTGREGRRLIEIGTVHGPDDHIID